MTHGSLFSGIGGFDLAAEWMGWTNVFNCEINEFCRKILNHHFPKAIQHEDITRTDFSIYRGAIDILSGGFPCQPYSQAGKRLGKADERHLFPEMLRAIQEIQPRFIVGENVRGLLNWNEGLVFNEVCADLEANGYEVATLLIPACAVDAPHRRDRVWFVASHSISERSKRYATNSRTSSEVRQTGASIAENSFFGGNTSNANSERHRGWHGNERGVQEREFQQDELGRGALGCEVAGCGGEWAVANAESNGDRRGLHQVEEENDGIRQSQKCWQDNPKFRHSCEERLSPTGSGKVELGRGNERDFVPNYWQNFPTQSPVCGGNDGLPAELDGITFPKWRRESIHAYGNAVVPQVVYQIFKAIQEVEDAMQTT